jgi:Ca2+-transporting ATPase
LDDLVLVEAGSRVPADIDIIEALDLRCDESLLTGESLPVAKEAIDLGERLTDPHPTTRAFAGTMVTRGRGRGVVFATGSSTRMGKIAVEIAKRSSARPPLMVRLDHFSKTIAWAVAGTMVLLVVIGLLRSMSLHELFMMSVGLAVAAIPEGLPVAISIALAIGMRRMAKAHVVVRTMPAIESLGSCTMIATDKTGTLTKNELAVTDIVLPDGKQVPSIDSGIASTHENVADSETLYALLRAAALPNEGRLIFNENDLNGEGDEVDVALLVAAHRGGVAHEEILRSYPVLARIPYEPDKRYAASFHQSDNGVRIFAKGAPETLIAMADRMDVGGRAIAIDRGALLRQKEALTAKGLRVLAFADGVIAAEHAPPYGDHYLVGLVFLGLVGMRDPIRPEVPDAIRACRRAGIEIVMITGDDPTTASVIATEAGMDFVPDEVVTGEAVRAACELGDGSLDTLTRRARIYARVEPAQKLAIVRSLARNGHFVAVTGDGINDAPALKHAHVGIAMGRKGTDVARESAGIILTDDNFASIVGGIREGRVAYANIRKVIFMVISTGIAEIVLFLLAILLGLPMPLLPVQLLWLNLVTNGIQDVALAAEKAEGDELSYPPRAPSEPILDPHMIRRVWHSALVMGAGGVAFFWWLIANGSSIDSARNLLLLLFVLFENVQTFNSRSERHSVFRQKLRANPLLVTGILASQALHIAAMHVPGLSDTLWISPVSLGEWAVALALALTLLLVMECDKWWDRQKTGKLETGDLEVQLD